MDTDEIERLLSEHYGSRWCPTCHVAGQIDWSEPWDYTRHQAEIIVEYLTEKGNNA